MHDTNTPDTRGPVAYKLRSMGHQWADVGEMLGITAKSRNVLAAAAAREHAKKANLPWPPPNAIGRQVYEMYEEDMSWDRIAKALNRPAKDIQRFAQKHGKTMGLPWPPMCSNGNNAYIQALQGLTWEEIGEHMGRTPRETRAIAKSWALYAGMAWPLPSVSRMMRRAYMLYNRTDMSWGMVAMMLGYSHPAHAIEGARKCAQVMCWKWPLSEGGRRGPELLEAVEMSGCLPYHDIADGDSWEAVQARYDYGYMHNIREATKRYADRGNMPWPPCAVPNVKAV